MADFCISDDLRQLLEFMKNSPDLMLRTIRTVPSCSAPKQTVSPVPEDNLPCQQRIDNVAESVLVMKQLIREGAPAELQEVMAKLSWISVNAGLRYWWRPRAAYSRKSIKPPVRSISREKAIALTGNWTN